MRTGKEMTLEMPKEKLDLKPQVVYPVVLLLLEKLLTQQCCWESLDLVQKLLCGDVDLEEMRKRFGELCGNDKWLEGTGCVPTIEKKERYCIWLNQREP